MTTPYVAKDWNAELRSLDTLVILGAYGGAKEIYWQLLHVHPAIDVVFVDDVTDITEVDMAGRVLPVVKDWDFSSLRAGRSDRGGEPYSQFIVGLGHPPDKKKMVAKALAHGLRPAPTVVHGEAMVGDDCIMGRGGMVMARCVVTTCVTLGDYVLLQNTTVGYDVKVGDYASCYPESALSSETSLGEGGLLGAGAIVRDGRHVAAWVTVGGQSFVAADVVEPGIVVAGVPARKLELPPTATSSG